MSAIKRLQQLKGWRHDSYPDLTRDVIELMQQHEEMLDALRLARQQLEEYERERSGETFNNTTINAAIARAEGRS